MYGAGDGARTRDIQLGKNNDDIPSIKFYNKLLFFFDFQKGTRNLVLRLSFLVFFKNPT